MAYQFYVGDLVQVRLIERGREFGRERGIVMVPGGPDDEDVCVATFYEEDAPIVEYEPLANVLPDARRPSRADRDMLAALGTDVGLPAHLPPASAARPVVSGKHVDERGGKFYVEGTGGKWFSTRAKAEAYLAKLR